MRSFDDLVAEADQVPVDGWDFSWLNGRATEERPPWAYARNLAGRLRQARAALDLQTGGGEVLGEAGVYPPVAVATEAWPPNLAVATVRLHPLGVVVVGHDGLSSLPFADRSFDLVTSRHPVSTDWAEIARVLAPGGTYFSQQVGPASMVELSEAFLGPLPDADRWRRPEDACAAAEVCGLEVVNIRSARLRAEFHDIGAIVYILHKCVWWVPASPSHAIWTPCATYTNGSPATGRSWPTPAASSSKPENPIRTDRREGLARRVKRKRGRPADDITTLQRPASASRGSPTVETI